MTVIGVVETGVAGMKAPFVICLRSCRSQKIIGSGIHKTSGKVGENGGNQCGLIYGGSGVLGRLDCPVPVELNFSISVR